MGGILIRLVPALLNLKGFQELYLNWWVKNVAITLPGNFDLGKVRS